MYFNNKLIQTIMKKQFLKMGIFFAATILVISCATKKSIPIAKEEKSVEIALPFSEKAYQSDSQMFRAKNYGKSPDMATAKKIAMTNALSEIATRIQNTVKMVTDNYTNQRTVTDKQEFENKFEEMARIVVNQNLQNIDVIGEKVFKESDGKYTYWIVIETSKDKIVNGINDKISNDAKLKLDFDKYQYQKIFDEEMKKFENQ